MGKAWVDGVPIVAARVDIWCTAGGYSGASGGRFCGHVVECHGAATSQVLSGVPQMRAAEVAIGCFRLKLRFTDQGGTTVGFDGPVQRNSVTAHRAAAAARRTVERCFPAQNT